MAAWSSVEKTATGPDGAKMGYVGGSWIPVEKTATGPDGARMAFFDSPSAAPAKTGPDAIPGQSFKAPASDGSNKKSASSGFSRVMDAAGDAAMAVPMAGAAAGMGLKALGKTPAALAGAAKYGAPILESMVPKTGIELLKMGGGAAAAGTAGEVARSKAKDSGAGPSGQRLAEMGGAMIPGAVGLAGREAVRGIDNASTKWLRGLFNTPAAKEGTEIVKGGFKLTPGQESGSETLKFAEQRARESFVTRGQVAQADKAQADAAVAQVKKLADGISVQDFSKAGVGERLQTAVENAVKRIDILRDKTGDKDYGLVRQLAGGKPVIEYKNTVAALQKIIQENTGVVSADAKQIVSQAKSQLAELTQTTGASTSSILSASGSPMVSTPPVTKPKVDDINTAMQNRKAWSRASKGNGDIFKDVSPDANRVVAARLASAINQDFEAASTAKTPFADALKTANKNFADYSKSIDFVQKSALGKMIGVDLSDAGVTGAVAKSIPGERVADRFLKMTPSEARQVALIIKQSNPEVLAEAKSYILRDVLKQSMDMPVSQKANALPISYNKVIKGLKDREYLEAAGFTKKEMGEIDTIVKGMYRSGDRSGANNAGTASANDFYSLLRAVGRPVKEGVSTVAQIAFLKKIANAMTKPDGRDALLTLTKFDNKKQAGREITRALAVVNSYEGDK